MGETERGKGHGSIEQRLDELLVDCRMAFPGCIGLEASIEVRDFQTDDERVFAAPWLVCQGDEDDIDEADFRQRRPDLWRYACKLMEELAVDCFDGERFPDGVFWPESLY